MSALLAALILDDLRYRTTLESARSYASMLTVFRDYYTSVVVAQAKKGGLPIDREYHKREGAIPPPATMSIEMGVWMGDLLQPGDFRFISKYPFRSRSEGGPKSAFEREALDLLANDRKADHTTIARVPGVERPMLHFAQPIAMGSGCVACHNSHPDSIKTDWKIGDIRGVQIVTLQLPPLLPSLSNLYNRDASLLVSSILLLLGIGLASLMLLKLMQGLRRAIDIVLARNRQLSRARGVAEQAAEAKARILHNISHELRTPMNAIVGFSELMRTQAFGPLGNKRYVGYAHDVNNSAEQLMGLIENMLALSEADTVKTGTNVEALDTRREVELLIQMSEQDAAASGISLTLDPEAELPVLALEKHAFRRALGNLIENAAQHGGRGTRAVVSADVTDECVLFSVVDDGKGISQTDFKRILQPSEGVADPGLSNARGIGLGLNVARELAAAMGGSVHIETDEGMGLKARLRLPISCLVGIPQAESVDVSADQNRASA